jgi:predicted transcriptional regulator
LAFGYDIEIRFRRSEVIAAYLVDVETYDDLQRQLTTLRGIARGERAVEEGRTVPHAEAKKRMARWLK